MRDSKKRIHLKKQQVLIIGGGNAYTTPEEYEAAVANTPLDLERLRPKRSWKTGLQKHLGSRFDVLIARMPKSEDAMFTEWKQYLEKIIPLLDDNVILVGHSLGGIFLVNYLNNYWFTKPIKALVLIAAPFDDESQESLGDFALEGKFDFLTTIPVHLFHSTDDPVVPYGEMLKYRKALTNVFSHTMVSRQHFNQAEFPELVTLIRKLSSK